MAVTAPPRGLPGSLLTRQARPLTGKEVAEAVEKHLLTLSERMLSEMGCLTDETLELIENLKPTIHLELANQSRLQKVNVTYPKVGWAIKTRVEEFEDGSRIITADVELDLERNVRLNLQFGRSGGGIILKSLEEEKIPNATPDRDRQSFGLPVEAEYMRPDGTVGKVDINELKGERRAARTVDVGRAAVEGASVTQGEPVVLPSELPEVSLDDLIAEPPPPPKEP